MAELKNHLEQSQTLHLEHMQVICLGLLSTAFDSYITAFRTGLFFLNKYLSITFLIFLQLGILLSLLASLL